MWAITIRAESTPAAVSVSSVRVDHHRRPGLDARRRHRREDPRHVADETVGLDRALEETGLHAGVVDALAQLAHEQRRDRVDVAVGQEVRQREEGVDTARDDDVEVDRLVDPLDPRDVAAEPQPGRVDDSLDAGLADLRQPRDRVGDADLLVPVAGSVHAAVVPQRLGLHDQDVLVRQRRAELACIDRAPDCLDGAHRLSSVA